MGSGKALLAFSEIHTPALAPRHDGLGRSDAVSESGCHEFGNPLPLRSWWCAVSKLLATDRQLDWHTSGNRRSSGDALSPVGIDVLGMDA
jgi:hypothetical protein